MGANAKLLCSVHSICMFHKEECFCYSSLRNEQWFFDWWNSHFITMDRKCKLHRQERGLSQEAQKMFKAAGCVKSQ
ncbi:hypothetical protein AQUCO_00700612v1 [Aquilegia coerulea]|uniref:Uncharacterized protein n=1 Tax=Aquilegia coerulea TaxID=218851 RepID=A0A2G5EKW7_AQUCA|nr:hypothetical protein AQUCO_00700612v1 [Aquilegia coerulea]